MIFLVDFGASADERDAQSPLAMMRMWSSRPIRFEHTSVS